MRLQVLSRSRRPRGQAMVLGALSFLLLALMVALSFNLSHALREKMSLQQHSDVLAYSMGVLEARALNYYAVSNRSMAATYVAMNSMHAYMSAASVTGAMMGRAQSNFSAIAGQEFEQCSCKGCYEHCVHGMQANQIAGKYGKAVNQYNKKVKGLEGSFRQTMEGLDGMVDAIHQSQAKVHENLVKTLQDGNSSGLEQLRAYNAPGASTLVAEVGSLNANEFNCAVDGMPCTGSVGNTTPETRAKVMTEVANASRPDWPANRGLSAEYPAHLHPDFLQELTQKIPGEGAHILSQHSGTAKTSDGDVGGGSGSQGKAIVAREKGQLSDTWKHGAMSGSYESHVLSDANGGSHSGGGHSGSHRFEGVNAKALEACVSAGNCFMKFRANEDAERDFGQPRVYSYVTQSFRLGDPKKGPWELNSSATLQFDNKDSTASLTLAADEGAALSKALVYYHRLGDEGWKEAPNLFNPYWRVKLHPFTPKQASQVLSAAGNADAAQVASSAKGLAL